MAYLGSLAPCFTISAAGEGRTPKRRRDPPKHNSSPSRESEWSRSVDNVFARRFLAWRKTPRDHLSTERRQAPSRLCGECESLPLLEPGFELFLNRSLLRKKLGHCELCKIFYHALWPSAAPLRSVWPVRLYRDGTNLVADGYDKPLLRICVDSDWAGDSTVQVGPRAFPERSSPAYFELLLEWLRDCDINHEDIGCHMRSRESWLPTRIIDVGDKNEAEGGILRLVHTRMWWWSRSRYVALSHRWGRRSSKDNARNCTLISNLEDHCQSIKFDELGRTFQDAITVTRQLGQRYLWIDSLCIVQDDKDDCNREIKCMEQVFASAYCVIAAASAEGTDAGFLGPRPPNQSVSVLTSSSETPLYICQSIDDFRGEVEGAGLSRRGWVLQERALARRTIFFGSGQTYWECGVGIRSEGMAFLTNQAASFLGDPRFPEMVTRGNLEDQRQVFQTVFKMYSNLELTYATDRPRAIAGIERRLASVMGSSVAFGVFSGSGCLHHSLLWRRVGDTLLQQINSSTFFVPTWSWMAFDGAIDYLDVAPAGVIWNTHISFVSSMAEVHTELGVPVVAFNLDNMSRDLELLILDGQHTADVRNLGCVIVGRRELPQGQEDEYYILVVSPAPAGRTNIEYQRLGVAIVQKVHIAIEWGSWHGRLI
ncbi:heterokaryon incompatibility protein-domain-containing protein [Lasiosphaeria hispida]|uniref:Heterokaryon incompatibility protein-domain-containing protein n=1 Tax=Lasiosphaeria hispida TaxID=260671 RepID=A0AAJ0HEU2_9PEZI|nr:heterokaryon incompatibility protein-domain-containing protein [Lasiosphaeria hispida]